MLAIIASHKAGDQMVLEICKEELTITNSIYFVFL